MYRISEMFKTEFVRVPRPLIRKFGLQTATVLSELYSEYNYWKDTKQLGKGGWFFSTIENMTYMTGLSKHQQSKACNALADYGIIQIKYNGMPPKRYFRFNLAAIDTLQKDFKENTNENKKYNGQSSLEEEDTEKELEEDLESQENTKYEFPNRNFQGFSF